MRHKVNAIKKTVFQIHTKYAFAQGLYWSSTCVFLGFGTVFLLNRGLTNTQVGLCTALGAILAISIQLIVSDFCDKHARVPIKRFITVLFIVCLLASSLLMIIPSSIAFVMAVFIVGYSCTGSNNSLLNALFMQLSNAGVPVNYGIPRGIGSLGWAVTAYFRPAFGKCMS